MTTGGTVGGIPADRCCADVAVHSHDGGRTLQRDGRPYSYRHAFQWRRPKVVTYRAADPRRLVLRLNRYPGVAIGAEVQVRGRCFGVVWGRPGRIIDTSPGAP